MRGRQTVPGCSLVRASRRFQGLNLSRAFVMQGRNALGAPVMLLTITFINTDSCQNCQSTSCRLVIIAVFSKKRQINSKLAFWNATRIETAVVSRITLLICCVYLGQCTSPSKSLFTLHMKLHLAVVEYLRFQRHFFGFQLPKERIWPPFCYLARSQRQ